MPELPDLQVFSHNLDKKLKGKKVKEVSARVTKKLNVPLKELKEHLEGQTVKKVYREGKQLYLLFSKGDILSLHLMLHGGLKLLEGENKEKHTILDLVFEGNKVLALTDWQNAATPTLNPEENKVPDALAKDITVAYMKEKLQTKRNIKTILLDQKVIRGIGNAYADEILWEARISPFSAGNKLPDAAIKSLVCSIKKVLTDAAQEIRKTHPDIISGEVRDFLQIHNAKKKVSAGGAEIRQKEINARKTYYTDEQELYS
jgi:formamidopyrimidine-DNA glycosylase